jgi:DNA invertase Pin-like site-specific DNA recombinase
VGVSPISPGFAKAHSSLTPVNAYAEILPPQGRMNILAIQDKVRKLKEQNMGATEIAKKLKIGRSTVYKILGEGECKPLV